MDLVTVIGAICAPGALRPLGGGMLLGLFLAGLSGSVLHCMPMCGPFVLAQAAARMELTPVARLCEMHRIRTGTLVPYHLGRLTTYAILGGLAGSLGDGLGRVGWFGALSATMLGVAAALFLAHAARRMFPALARIIPGLDPAPAILVKGLSRLVGEYTKGHGYRLGVLLGFLPCGLLYAALATSAAGQSLAGGAVALLVFGLGTTPALVGIGILGHGALRLANSASGVNMARLAPVVLIGNAAVLTLLAWQRLTVLP